MGSEDSKSYQLRVRVTAEERDLLERLRIERNRGETISDLVREAIGMLVKPVDESNGRLSPSVRLHVDRLAELLKREPRQVEEACVEGILDLIERKCDVPLIVMETHLHLKYRGREETAEFPWDDATKTDAPKPDIEPSAIIPEQAPLN
jgi:hypothetical protein